MDLTGEMGLFLLFLKKKQKRKVFRRFKVRPLNRDRKTRGFFKATFLRMKELDNEQFFKYTRMHQEVFNELLTLVTPLVQKSVQYNAISPEERLAITLHYLSQGSSMQIIAWTYKMGKSTVHYIIKDMCSAIFSVLEPTYLKAPNTMQQWLRIADHFWHRWNFPQCLGAIDGKHIDMKAPNNSGSLFFNYKKTFSIILLGICDGNYNFTVVDIGTEGSSSDGGVFQESNMASAIESDQFQLPPDSLLPNSPNPQLVPYCFVGDAAFPLQKHVLRPYAGTLLPEAEENFNYRLSRARRVIENTFGVLAARWRILLQTINADVELVESIVKTCVCLHNFLRQKTSTYVTPGYVDTGDTNDGLWRMEIDRTLASIKRTRGGNTKHRDLMTRDYISNYLLHEGNM